MHKMSRLWLGITGGVWLSIAGAAGLPPPSIPHPVIEPEMVMIAGGNFLMGCQEDRDKDCDADEKPTHAVRVNRFFMGKYEVTQAEWKSVMGNNPSSFKDCGERCPVERVSWNDVQIYIQKLNSLTGKFYRLPTEAEWEYACRANSAYKYCGSDSVDEVSWHWESNPDKSYSVGGREFVYDPSEPYINDNRTHPVGMKKPNGFGLYDMSGNVYEWTQDVWHEDYNQAPSEGSKFWDANDKNKDDLTIRKWRVLRGGPWNLNSKSSRATIRRPGWTVNQSDAVGFRLVKIP